MSDEIRSTDWSPEEDPCAGCGGSVGSKRWDQIYCPECVGLNGSDNESEDDDD